MQQTKQTRQAGAGGAAARHSAVARQLSAVTKPDAGSSPTIPGLPPGGFSTILVDPPWPAQSGEKHYRTMSLARIKALPVGQLAARDAHLWLWTTNALLPKAYEVAESWGFTVRSPLTWVKFRLGLGGRYQLRNATEQLLFCTRGRAPWGRVPSRPGSMRQYRSTRVSRLSSSPLSSGLALGRTWSCLPAGGLSRTSPGRCGATKWTQISASPASPCRATASGHTRTRRPCDESAVARQVPNPQSSRRW